jgi:5,10-methylenetetrahydromethanopterin reductase
VYVAANGPRNLALAGACADGVILLSGVSHEALERGLRFVREGAASVGRDLAALRVVTSAFCLVTDDVERDARLLKPVCAQVAQTGGQRLLEIAGIRLDVPVRVPEVYPDLIHAEDWPAAVDVCGRWVSDADALAFARTFCLFGSVEEVTSRIRDVAGRGVTALLLQHIGSYDLPHALIEAVGGDMLARLSP